MKPIIVDMKNMTDSVEVYESRPNHLFMYFIYSVAAMLIIAFLWMYFAKIDIVVRSNGVFRSEAPAYDVTCQVSGVITECNIKEGNYVAEGDTLFTIGGDQLEQTIEGYKIQLERAELRIEILKAYQAYLNGEKDALEAYSTNSYYDEFVDRKELLELNIDVSAAGMGTNKAKNMHTLTERQSISQELLTCQEKRTEYEKALEQYDVKNGNLNVKADVSGYITLNQLVNQGSYVSLGTSICQILPEQSREYFAEIYVDNTDIGKIKEGQLVKFEIAAYPSAEYGYFTGTVETISKNIKVDSVSGSAYYPVKVKCDETMIGNKEGETGSLLNGMACQGKIVVDEKRVLIYFLEKINFL